VHVLVKLLQSLWYKIPWHSKNKSNAELRSVAVFINVATCIN
jgi:hypothetical protein